MACICVYLSIHFVFFCKLFHKNAREVITNLFTLENQSRRAVPNIWNITCIWHAQQTLPRLFSFLCVQFCTFDIKGLVQPLALLSAQLAIKKTMGESKAFHGVAFSQPSIIPCLYISFTGCLNVCVCEKQLELDLPGLSGPWINKRLDGEKKLWDTSVMQKIEASEKHRPDLNHEGRYTEHVCSISSILFHLMG